MNNLIKQPTKFIVSFKAKVALIPNISEETGPVVDITFVRSPAPKILVIYILYKVYRILVNIY
jgi:hypothetical protein